MARIRRNKPTQTPILAPVLRLSDFGVVDALNSDSDSSGVEVAGDEDNAEVDVNRIKEVDEDEGVEEAELGVFIFRNTKNKGLDSSGAMAFSSPPGARMNRRTLLVVILICDSVILTVQE